MSFFDTILLSAVVPGTVFFVLLSVVEGLRHDRVLLSGRFSFIVFLTTLDFLAVAGIASVLVFASDYYSVPQPEALILGSILVVFFILGLVGIGYLVHELIKRVG